MIMIYGISNQMGKIKEDTNTSISLCYLSEM